MTMYRCTESIVIGNESGEVHRDHRFIEDKNYDDRNEPVKAAIKRFPEHFTPVEK